jgi:hypothetical protein
MILSIAPGRDRGNFYRAAEFSELPDPLCKRKMDEFQQKLYSFMQKKDG